ncbi:MAG: hypothetical protein Q4G09_08030 [Clostridia bacterium]|nr:hypothetical protein [Clostridia bacterium]
MDEGKYKQLSYKVFLYEDYYEQDKYIIEIETNNHVYSEICYDIERLKNTQERLLEEYSKIRDIGIFDLYIGSYAKTNTIIIEDMKEYQDILKSNNRKYNTTYGIKSDLCKMGFKWNDTHKKWEKNVKSKDEKQDLIIQLIKKYQNEYPEKELEGIRHCWECGAAYIKHHEC